jgi:hypothetical protein
MKEGRQLRRPLRAARMRRQEKPFIGYVMQITISNQANAIFKLGH